MRERERGGEKKIFFASLDNLDRLMILVIIFFFFFRKKFEKILEYWFWMYMYICVCTRVYWYGWCAFAAVTSKATRSSSWPIFINTSASQRCLIRWLLYKRLRDRGGRIARREKTVFETIPCRFFFDPFRLSKSVSRLQKNEISFNGIISKNIVEISWSRRMINLVTGFLELLVQLPSFHPKRDAKQRNKRY